MRFMRKPLDTPTDWYARYGDPFTIRAINGDVVMTAQPDRIREMFSADPALFDPFAPQAIAPLTGPASLLVLKGARHRAERKLLMPPFHGARMRAYGRMMDEVARRRFAEVAGDEPFDALKVTQAISLEVILRAVLGLRPDEVDAVAVQVVQTVDGISPVFLFAPFLQVRAMGLTPWDRHVARYEALDALMQARIEQLRAHDGAEAGEDILSLMLSARYEDGSSMADDDIKDELRTLLVAGHETTALSLAWALDAVHRHPDVQARLLPEVLDSDDSPEAFSRLPWLDAVCKETLRLYPVVSEVMRTLNQPWTFAGYDLPKGTSVAASVHLTHYNPELYPEPLSFKPERFETRSYSPFEYLPFGGGHRRCIGAAFANFELRVVLAAALRTLSFECVRPQAPKVVRRNITLAPEQGVLLRAHQR